jgi:hypothetical protein
MAIAVQENQTGSSVLTNDVLLPNAKKFLKFTKFV